MSGIVAVVGRPNVGKSTLFNRFTESRKAIVNDVAGVTRDRNYGKVEWNGREFSIIDTGGYVDGSDDIFEDEIRRQVHLAIEESDVILFVVNVEDGITELDNGVAELLRKSNKEFVLVVNKVDNNKRSLDATEFYSLGLGEYYCISSINGSGTGDLLDEVVNKLPEEIPVEDEDLPKLAFVGRPNVGKSSTVNILLDENRNIVTDMAGTTRDSISTRFSKFGHDFIMVDTAGLRKKRNVNEDVEFYSTLRSVRTIENSDVCILIIDATRGVEAQDVSIFNLIQRNRKGLVVMVNKWDLIENKDTNTINEFKERIHRRFAPFVDIPIIFTSAVTKQRIIKVLEEAMIVYERRTTRIATSKINDVMLPVIEAYPPPAYKGKYIKIKYGMQLPTHAPTFAFYCNLPQYIKDPYKRYIENKFRENFELTGVPIQIFFRKK
ncbi:ribosome biogenesis GTPase Der [Halosquirtibacter laminarini]|uniref:Ribosome biogenesis GTPase Der n=1 Tax=Halosquirtibacter laminarini TaxID=3374600 RepID=A0AC61ND27_9BACT|nr:ribosome biogenesis GTPase Der [Prolixibacteraceae bacterium]